MVAVAAGLIGVLLAVTVLDTDEGPNLRESGSMLGTTGPPKSGGGGPDHDQARVYPVPVDGPLLGVNLTAYTSDGYAKPSVEATMKTLVDLGSTAVTLVPTWYMKRATGNRILPDEEKTPSDESLLQAFEWAREAGLQIVLKPHVDVIDDSYRGDIQPADRKVWFRSYDRFIDHYASLASSNGAHMFVVGTELKTMSPATERWRETIRKVRARFLGPITYAANWDEADQVQFWDDLDAIGVDAYYPLTPEGGAAPTLEGLVDSWRSIAANLKAKSEQWERPVILAEIGYPSQVDATARPFEVTDKPADQAVQALAYRATFRVFSGQDWVEGISWWSWRVDPTPEENEDVEYSPERKKAQGELARGQWMFEG